MDIFYFDGTKTPDFKAKNFGDELNPWLWPQLIPNITKVWENVAFVGIGTLLNNRLPQNRKKIIFGSGAGYGTLPRVDPTWEIYFVRGKLTAKVLEVDQDFAITDSAILVRKIFTSSRQKKYKRSYMPHYMEAVINGIGWRHVCESLNIHYIDPTECPQNVLTQISETELLLTEAMHGAIVADILRTPWVAIKTHPRHLDFKWNDWLSNLDISYRPYSIARKSSIISKTSFLKYIDYQLIRTQIAYVLKVAKPNLSSQSNLNELDEKVNEQLEKLKNDISKG